MCVSVRHESTHSSTTACHEKEWCVSQKDLIPASAVVLSKCHITYIREWTVVTLVTVTLMYLHFVILSSIFHLSRGT